MQDTINDKPTDLAAYIHEHFTPGKRVRRPRAVDPALWRAATLRVAKQRARTITEASQSLSITITLNADEAAEFSRLRHAQKGSIEGFAKRALIVGSKFLANAGQGKQKPASRKG